MKISSIARQRALAVACLALAACHDTPTAPAVTDTSALVLEEPNAQKAFATLSVAAVRIEALHDALDRVHIALVRDERSKAISAGLRQAIQSIERGHASGASSALHGIEQALQKYTSRDDAMSADLDVIRLALRAASES